MTGLLIFIVLLLMAIVAWMVIMTVVVFRMEDNHIKLSKRQREETGRRIAQISELRTEVDTVKDVKDFALKTIQEARRIKNDALRIAEQESVVMSGEQENKVSA